MTACFGLSRVTLEEPVSKQKGAEINPRYRLVQIEFPHFCWKSGGRTHFFRTTSSYAFGSASYLILFVSLGFFCALFFCLHGLNHPNRANGKSFMEIHGLFTQSKQRKQRILSSALLENTSAASSSRLNEQPQFI